VVIAVEAGASGAGATTGGGGGTSCCADAETAVPNTPAAAMAKVAAPLGSVVRKIRFIGFFPLIQAAVIDEFERLQKQCRFTRLFAVSELKIE
jgi:hypothetical protein